MVKPSWFPKPDIQVGGVSYSPLSDEQDRYIASLIDNPASAIGQAVRAAAGGGGSSLLPMQSGSVYDSSRTTPMTVGDNDVLYTIPADKLVVVPLILPHAISVESFSILTEDQQVGKHGAMVIFADNDGLPGEPIHQIGEIELPIPAPGGVAEPRWTGSWELSGTIHVGMLFDTSFAMWGGKPAMAQYAWGGSAAREDREYGTPIAAMEDPDGDFVNWYNFDHIIPRVYFKLTS